MLVSLQLFCPKLPRSYHPSKEKRHAWDSLALPGKIPLCFSLVVIFASRSPGGNPIGCKMMTNNVWDALRVEPVNRHRQIGDSVKMLEVYLKCCFYTGGRSLNPFIFVLFLNSPGNGCCRDDVYAWGSAQNHSFCLRRVSKWVTVLCLSGPSVVCLSRKPYWQCQFWDLFCLYREHKETRTRKHARGSRLLTLPPSASEILSCCLSKIKDAGWNLAYRYLLWSSLSL